LPELRHIPNLHAIQEKASTGMAKVMEALLNDD